MPHFTIRVELKGSPSFQQYENLHALMARLGFGRQVPWSDNTGVQRTFQLPTGLYYGYRQEVTTTVVELVKQQVATMQISFTVFIAETTSWAGF